MEYTGHVIDQRIPLITPEDLNTFLSTGVRENFILDFKRDFPKNLEKTLAAFANTYGGAILIGVDETPTGAAVLPVHGLNLRQGLRERVLQIALDNIYPPLVPDVHVIPIKSSANIADADCAVIVVRVHESDDAPHAVEQRTAVYLRVDNVSDRFERKATIGEIEWLANKREKSVAEKARILRHVQMHAREYRERRSRRNTSQKPLEKGQIVFYTVPRYPRGQLAEPRRLREIAHSARVQIAAVPSFLPGGSPTAVPQGVLFDEIHGTSEFHEQGIIYHSFDFWWDSGSAETGPAPSRTVSPSVSAADILNLYHPGKNARNCKRVSKGDVLELRCRCLRWTGQSGFCSIPPEVTSIRFSWRSRLKPNNSLAKGYENCFTLSANSGKGV